MLFLKRKKRSNFIYNNLSAYAGILIYIFALIHDARKFGKDTYVFIDKLSWIAIRFRSSTDANREKGEEEGDTMKSESR